MDETGTETLSHKPYEAELEVAQAVDGTGQRVHQPLSGEYGTYKTVKARFGSNVAHIRQSRPDSGRMWHIYDSQGQILALAFR